MNREELLELLAKAAEYHKKLPSDLTIREIKEYMKNEKCE